MPLSWQTRQHLSTAGVYLLCALAALTASLASGGVPQIDGPLLDIVLWGRAELFRTAVPADRPVAVVALDQKSLDDPHLSVYPRAMFGPIWADLLNEVMTGGAKAIGFDLLLAYSGNQLVDDFDSEFLAALAHHGDKLVLARSATTVPAPAYQAALGSDEHSLGLVEILADSDGTYRRVSAALGLEDGGTLPSLANAVLHRAGVTSMPREVFLAPRWHLETIPTYSLVDVLHCAKTDPATITAVFRDKIVFIGTTLAEEDRKRSPTPYLRPPAAGPGRGACGLRQLGISVPRARTVPGVYLHAAAVEAVLTGAETRTAPVALSATLSALTALIGVLLALQLVPWKAVLGLVTTALMTLLGTIGVLEYALWIPAGLPLLALIGSASAAYLARYLFEDRRRREIQSAFSHYLSPAIVDRLAQDPSALKLGGERREITVMFADLSGFTQLSTRVPPEVLTRITNRYLGYMVQEVEATGGYVNQFLGDAVMAIWGAPVPDPQHAAHAVQAAQGIAARVMEAKAVADAKGEPGYTVKVGLNSGSAIVGNIGTDHRYNYTAVGETVNVAARLESVPTLYACRIVIGPEVAKLVKDEFLLRELDQIVVKGKNDPIAVYEPIVLLAKAIPAQREVVERYAEALNLYRAKRFAAAAEIWEQVAGLEADLMSTWPCRLAHASNPSARMAERARQFAADPPAGPWTGVWVLSGK